MTAVLVTGAAGFLGRRLTKALSMAGFEVVAAVRQESSRNGEIVNAARVLEFPLEAEPRPEFFKGIDLVIHGAHDFGPGARDLNVRATIGRAEVARRVGVRTQLFLSSYSAHDGAVSEYGQTKLEIERWFRKAGEIVVRPGLVAGSAGLFGRIVRLLRSSPLVPLIDGGRQKIPLVALSDFLQAMIVLCRTGSAGDYGLFHPDLFALADVIREIRKQARSRAILLSVPGSALLFASRVLEPLGIRLPVSRDSLEGLAANASISFRSDLPGLIGRPAGLEKIVAEALADG